MTKFQKAFISYKLGYRYLIVAIVYYFWLILGEFGKKLILFRKTYYTLEKWNFASKWVKKENNKKFFAFKNVKLPYTKEGNMQSVFDDVFFVYCLNNDNYDSKFIREVVDHFHEGPYCFVGEGININLNRGDVVIDAGSWIGDFAAYAAVVKGAKVYAFEPTNSTFEMLKETIALNKCESIIPIQKGLGAIEEVLFLEISERNSEENKIKNIENSNSEKISVTTIDDFVRSEKLEKIDFIKADIEGYERFMLMGATETLQKFAPKLAICTYHLPDDPKVLEDIILKANPNYTIIHTKKKLFAQVV